MIYKQATISCYVDKLKSIRGFTLLTVNQVKEIVGIKGSDYRCAIEGI